MTRTFSKLIFGIVVLCSFLSCEKINVPKDVPKCIQKNIKRIKKKDVSNPPSGVWQYEYNGQEVYYFPPTCCDMPSTLMDEGCKAICSPDGGLTGGGDGKCPDFFAKRTNEKLIWQDDRK